MRDRTAEQRDPIPPRYRLSLWIVSFVLVGCLPFVIGDPRNEVLAIGYIFGTIFTHATLAAAWATFAPAALIVRLPLSLLWLLLFITALTMNLNYHRGQVDVQIVTVTGAIVLWQWLLVQLLLWGLRIGLRLRLLHSDESARAPAVGKQQFGVRELLICTAVVGLALGIGRVTLSSLFPHLAPGQGGEAPYIILLAFTAIVHSLPLLGAAFLPRHAVPAVLIVLAVIGVTTFLGTLFIGGLDPNPNQDALILFHMSVCTSTWVLLFALVVRLNDYRLVNMTPTRES